MPLFILGLLVIVGLVVYMLVTGELRIWGRTGVNKARRKSPAKEKGPATVIVLPTDLEKEKKKRHVKTGKD